MRSRSLRQLKANLRSRLNGDGGFGLIEAVVALTIIFGLVLALMSTLDASSRVLVSTRQQSAANALATELIERAQALEYQNMGLAASVNGATCPGDIGCYTGDFAGRLIQVAPGYDFDGEPIVFATGDTFRPFLDFHAVLDRDGTDFNRYIFITSVDDDADGTPDYRRLTAVVRWATSPGFIDEAVQTTLIAPFVEPDQPLLRTDVSWEGGTFSISGRTDPLVYDPDTAIIGDEITVNPTANAALTASTLYDLSVVLPSVNVISISDYISRAIVRAETASIAASRFEGADGIFGTADDTTFIADPDSLAESADDDNVNATPPLNGPALGLLSGLREVSLNGLTVAEVDTGTVGALGPASTLKTSWLLDVLHDDVIAIPEQLPYAAGTLATTDELFIGADTANEEFTFYSRSGGAEIQGVGDRDDNLLIGKRDTLGSAALSSAPIQLFNDSIMSATYAGFDGWVVIEGRTGARLDRWGMLVQEVTAGESPYLVATTMGGAHLKVWDAAAGAYSVTDLSIAAGAQCGSPIFSTSNVVQQVVMSATPGIQSALGFDDIRYTVSIELDLRTFCETFSVDLLGNIKEHRWQTSGPIVSGTVDYVIEGRPTAGVYTAFLDFTAAVSLDQLSISSVYIDPEAN